MVAASATEEVEPLFYRRRLYLDVRHVLMEGDTMGTFGRPDWNDINKRMTAALLIKEPTVKSRRVERRLMLARGEQARKSKARRTA